MTKSEFRMTNQIRMTNVPMTNTGLLLVIRHWFLRHSAFVISNEIRIPNDESNPNVQCPNDQDRLASGHWSLVPSSLIRHSAFVISHWREALTLFLNLPAPGRRQSVYLRLRVRTDLCF